MAKIGILGVDMKMVYAHNLTLPRFLMDRERYLGYRTLEQLKRILNR